MGCHSGPLHPTFFGEIFETKFYYNVSRKIFGFLRYTYDHCPNVRCALKGDSDTVINLSGIEELCDSMPEKQHFVTGRTVHFVPSRRPWVKHYVPFFVWPSHDYPPFALGFSYLLSGRGIVPRMLVNLQRKTPFFKSENYRRLPEDIVYAGVVREIAGIPLNHNTGFAPDGLIRAWWHNEKPIVLSTEAKDQFSALLQISLNRLLNFPEFSNQDCYTQSFIQWRDKSYDIKGKWVRRRKNYGTMSMVVKNGRLETETMLFDQLKSLFKRMITSSKQIRKHQQKFHRQYRRPN